MTSPSSPNGVGPRVHVAEDLDAMKERISTWLSTLAILAMAGGLGWGLWPHLHAWCLPIAGAALALMVLWADLARRPPEAKPEPVLEEPPPPGPTDPGRVHVRGPGVRP